MQCVILAAGRGTRMGELTAEKPKPLLTINGQNLIEYKLNQLPPEIDEVILVIGHLGNQIQQYFGVSYSGRKISYVEQDELNGTGGALWAAKSLLKGKFLVMMGDDLYARADIERCLKEEWSMLVQAAGQSMRMGKVVKDENDNLAGILENMEILPGDMVNVGMYVLPLKIFDYPLIKIPGKKEFGLPQTIVSAAKDFPIKLINATFWVHVNTPADYAQADIQVNNLDKN